MVQSALAERGIAGDLVTFTTTGDKRLDEPLSTIGGKGLFTQRDRTRVAAREDRLRRALTEGSVHGPR